MAITLNIIVDENERLCGEYGDYTYRKCDGMKRIKKDVSDFWRCS